MSQGIIKPSNGRIVWFHPARGAGGGDRSVNGSIIRYDDQPLAAIIAYVRTVRLVNLIVVDHAGFHHPLNSVDLVQPGDKLSAALVKLGRYCEWMPYQISVAK